MDKFMKFWSKYGYMFHLGCAILSFIAGDISLTNFYLFILYAIYNPKLMENRDARVLIVDESHEFDDVMSDFITIRITEGVVKKFKFSNESDILKRLKAVINYETANNELLEEVRNV
jgi:Rad3-related DNA helicase